MRWLGTHAAELGVDLKRVIVSGGSAGGHLALCLGTFPESRELPVRPAALVAFNPVSDATNGAFGDSEARKRNAAAIGDDPEAISPIHHVSGQVPPALILHGGGDVVVPVSDSKRFIEALKKAGVKAELIEYPGRPHGFYNFLPGNRNPLFAKTLQESVEFIEAHMEIPAMRTAAEWTASYSNNDPAAKIEPF